MADTRSDNQQLVKSVALPNHKKIRADRGALVSAPPETLHHRRAHEYNNKACTHAHTQDNQQSRHRIVPHRFASTKATAQRARRQSTSFTRGHRSRCIQEGESLGRGYTVFESESQTSARRGGRRRDRPLARAGGRAPPLPVPGERHVTSRRHTADATVH